MTALSDFWGESQLTPLPPPPDAVIPAFPERPGAPPCDFFAKTGHCRYGELCRFDHPRAFAVGLSRESGLPVRPGEPRCSFFERTGACKYGACCKFDHSPFARAGGGGGRGSGGGEA